jgi:hypothetical protein
MRTKKDKLRRLAISKRTLRTHGFDFDKLAAEMLDPEILPILKARYANRPGPKPEPKLVRELADAKLAHTPGQPWKCATPDPSRAGELSKKAAWGFGGDRFDDVPKNRTEESHRRQAIEADALILSDGLTEKDELASQVRRVRGRILKARRSQT